jgi:hypothetical protein
MLFSAAALFESNLTSFCSVTIMHGNAETLLVEYSYVEDPSLYSAVSEKFVIRIDFLIKRGGVGSFFSVVLHNGMYLSRMAILVM